MAENVECEISAVTYCGSDQQVSEGFAIALRVMGFHPNFPPADRRREQS